MHKLSGYIFKECLGLFWGILLLNIGLSILSNILPVVQWLGGSNIIDLLKFIALQIPAAATMAFAPAMVLSTLLALGRLSKDYELVAIMAGGVPLWRVAREWLYFAGALGLVSLALSEWVIPQSNDAKVLLYYNQLTGKNGAIARMAKQDIAVGKYRLSFERFDTSKQTLEGVRLESWDKQQLTLVKAQSAVFSQSSLKFKDYIIVKLDTAQLPVPEAQSSTYLQKLIPSQTNGQGQTLTVTLSKSREQLETEYAGGFESPKPLSHWWKQYQKPTATITQNLEARSQLHLSISMAMGSLAVALMAISLVARNTRQVSLGLGIALTVAYYLLFAIGKSLALSGQVAPELAAWLPTLVALAVALWPKRA